MAVIYIEGKEYEVNAEDNLLKVCLSLGIDIPYFCWHPILGSVGACRQCAVKQFQNFKDKNGHLVMSCMTSAASGTCISIEDKEAKEFRKSIIELLMINHPHDCPVCEEGGSCHLQDMTVMTGHNVRRYRFTKRTHRNQNLGPFISHEMNRCITCYRCVRYYKDYADGDDLGVYGVHDNIYFGRLKDGPLKSEFSGNLVDICPTGVFTDKTHSEHYNRKWDMQFAPSICQHCSLGCNISLAERYGELRRIENRYNNSINHYFLCDRGRFGYGYVNLKDRPRQPFQRNGNGFVTIDLKQTMQVARDILCQSKKTIGIGSARASIESNFALRELVGAENFFTGIHEAEQDRLQLVLKILNESGIYTPTLREIECYDAVLILGEDLTQTAARAALAVRQAIKSKVYKKTTQTPLPYWHISAILNRGQHAKHPLFITSIDNTRLDDIAAWTYYAPIEDQARLGFAVAHALDKNSPAVELDSILQNKVNIIAQALSRAKKPLIISGTNAGSMEIIQAAANIAKALKGFNSNVGITMIAHTVNSIGLSMIGGGTLESALNELESGAADAVIVLENDLYRHMSATRIDSALNKEVSVIVIDHQHTKIMDKAHLVLSAASFAESSGTVINNEGRAQRFFQVYDPAYYNNKILMLESWRWLYSIYNIMMNNEIDWIKLDDVIDAVVKTLPQLADIKYAAPDSSFRIHGQKLARSPHRYSGRTAMCANVNIHESRYPEDKDTMFIFSMEGNNQPSALHSYIPFAWAPGWNSSQAWHKFQTEVGGSLHHGDPGIRLIKESESSLGFFTDIPLSFKSHRGLRIVPYYHLFGSDELSQRSHVFQSRMPQPYIKLSQTDAKKFGVSLGTNITFMYDGQTISLPLIISKNLMPGQAGLPVGFPGIALILIGAQLELDNLQKEKK